MAVKVLKNTGTMGKENKEVRPQETTLLFVDKNKDNREGVTSNHPGGINRMDGSYVTVRLRVRSLRITS